MFPNRKFKMSKKRSRENETDQWEVEDILDHKIDPKGLNAKFLVRWKAHGNKTWEPTWEPMDCVYTCPVLLHDLTKKKRGSLQRPMKERKLSQEALDRVGNFTPIPDQILAKFNDPMEFIPTGNEKIKRVLQERLNKDKTIFLWCIIFKGESEPCLIRKCVACYYWPFEASMFMTYQVYRCAKLKRVEDKIAEKNKAKVD